MVKQLVRFGMAFGFVVLVVSELESGGHPDQSALRWFPAWIQVASLVVFGLGCGWFVLREFLVWPLRREWQRWRATTTRSAEPRRRHALWDQAIDEPGDPRKGGDRAISFDSRVMAAMFLVVLWLAYTRYQSWVIEFLFLGIACVNMFLIFPIYVFHELILPLTLGVRCPACGKRALRKLARQRGRHECSECGHRCKRGTYLDPWVDASGEDDDARRFSAGPRGGTWETYIPPVNPGKSTAGILLRNKRWRNPSAVIKKPESHVDSHTPMADPWLDG